MLSKDDSLSKGINVRISKCGWSMNCEVGSKIRR